MADQVVRSSAGSVARTRLGIAPQARHWTVLAAALLLLAVAGGLAWPGGRAELGLPPLLSGEEDTLAGVQHAHLAVLAAQQPYQAAEAALSAVAANGNSLPYDPAQDVATVAMGGSAATAALERAVVYGNAVVHVSETATAYQTAIQAYDDALMARTRGLGPKSEELRSATWPFVEYVKRFPPPLGLDASLHPPTSAALATQVERLRGDEQALAGGNGSPGQAAADLAQLAAAAPSALKVASFLPEYQHLLEVYAGQVEKVAAAPEPAAHDARAVLGATLAAILLSLLAVGTGLLVWRRPALLDAEIGLPALAVALMFAGYLIGPSGPALLAALGFLIVATLSPTAAVVAIAAAIPFFFHPRAVGHWHFPAAELALGLTCLAVAARFLSGDRAFLRTDAFRLNRVDILAVLFLVAGTLSLLVPERSQLHIALRSYRVVVVEPLVFYVLFTRLLREQAELRWALDAFIVVLSGIGWLATTQFLTATDTWTSGGVDRALGVEPSATSLGIELGRGVTLALVLALFHPDGRRRLAYAALSIPGGLGLLASFTRGAWIASGAAVAAAAVVRRQWQLVAGIASLGLIGAGILATSHVERLKGLFSLESGSDAARLAIWSGTLGMLHDHPVMGIGLDQFLAQQPQRYGIPELRFLVISHPHNVLLDAWLQLGLLGAVVAIALVLSTLATAFALARGATTPLARAWGLALLAAMVEFVVHGMVDEGYFTGDLALTFWLLVGAVEVFRRDQVMPAVTADASSVSDVVPAART